MSPLFKQNVIPIKNNYYHASKRYKTLKQMIGRDNFKNNSEAIQQMIEKEKAEEVQKDPMEARNMDRNINYLPHHGVFKFDRISTKCRIVFDASAKNSEGVSLNSNFLPGPKRQLDIILLLINFRLHPYTLV